MKQIFLLLVSFLLIAFVEGQEAKLMLPVGHTYPISNALFYAKDKYIVSHDNIDTKIWEVSSGRLLRTYFNQLPKFSKDGQMVLKKVKDTIQLWDFEKDTLRKKISLASSVSSVDFSNDGNIICVDANHEIRIVDTLGKVLYSFGNGTTFIKDRIGEKLLTTTSDNGSLKIWDIRKGKLLIDVKDFYQEKPGYKSVQNFFRFSYDNAKLAIVINYLPLIENGYTTVGGYSSIIVFDITIGVKILEKVNNKCFIEDIQFSPDDKNIAKIDKNGVEMIMDLNTGKSNQLTKQKENSVKISFSPDGANFLIISEQGHVRMFNTLTWKEGKQFVTHSVVTNSINYSANGDKLVIGSLDKTLKVWDIMSGQMVKNLAGSAIPVEAVFFSPNGQFFGTIDTVAVGLYSTNTKLNIKLWNTFSGALEGKNKDIFPELPYLNRDIFNQNPVRLHYFQIPFKGSITNWQMPINYWTAFSGFASLRVSPNRYFTSVVTASIQNYSLAIIDSSNYLVFDNEGHFDGTEAARKLLYFVSGTEIIELEQLKDRLWVPNLAERKMKGEAINAPSLEDLKINNLTPIVEAIDERSNQQYRYSITPQNGGLGETVLYVNGIEAKRYQPLQLIKKGKDYELVADTKEVEAFFKQGEDNKVTVKAFTAKNDIASRGISITKQAEKTNLPKPHLYAVMVGVSDYKGNELDLKYAAKDATDLSKAIQASAAKLLGEQQVHMYNLTTEQVHYALPEKKTIQQTLVDIGKKATANDILLVFFAGHGIMAGDKKQFYFLTADASKASATDAVEGVGISTAELSDWMKPQNIKAQKRILILDACNSGQAIKDLVQIGAPDKGYLAARSDDNAQQIKAIDKLNEKSGLFILAASASNQSAYEMGRYSQGLLTFSLLKVMKQQPDILEDGKFLNVSRWFNSAEKELSAIVKQSGARQEPQIVSTTNFNIGTVDAEVMAAIQLPNEKAIFTRSNCLNATLKIDNLKIRNLIDKALNSISSRGDNSISYNADYEGTDAYSLAGEYTVSGNVISVTMAITKGDGTLLRSFTTKGNTDDLNKLVNDIAEQAVTSIK